MGEFNRNNQFQVPEDKWKAPSRAMLRKAQRATVLPGFPSSVQFTTIDEVEQYLSGEKLQCLLCGKMFLGLGNHIALQHGVPAMEYKHRYGIPYRRGLAAESTKQKHRDFSSMRLSDPANLALLLSAAKKARAVPRTYKPTVASVKNQRIDRIETSRLYLNCMSCGKLLDVATNAPSKCAACKSEAKALYAPHHRENAKRHYYKDLEHSRESLRQRAARGRAKKKLAEVVVPYAVQPQGLGK